MNLPDPEPILATRLPPPEPPLHRPRNSHRIIRALVVFLLVLLILAPAAYLYARHWVRAAVHDSLPQLDGALTISGLSAPVTAARDAHGVPTIHAASIDDLVLAQGFVTAQDRLFQMDLLRRHAAGELAEILGSAVLGHDRLQRTLQIRASADRALTQLPPAQLHLLERYAAGVNASIAAQSQHLPVEFRVLRYQPAPWTPRDSLLVSLAMFQDLTNTFPEKLARESLLARLPAEKRAQFEQDLYPVGSWRDHPPAAQLPDLTIEGPKIEDIPLDESQAGITPPQLPVTASSILSAYLPCVATNCPAFTPGSNNWAVSGARTASGKPLLSNDPHLSHSLPGIWYEADLSAAPFHAAGLSLPGIPLIVIGHNDHIAWGFTNLGADVQDLYLESTRGAGASQEFLAADGTWQPIVHLSEPIRVKGGETIAYEVLATRHGDTLTPLLNAALGSEVAPPSRPISLRWTLFDPANLHLPTLEVDSAHDWPSFLAALADIGGPAQNVVYADDQGHIGFHAVGRIPLRGPAGTPPAPPQLRAPFIAPSAMSGIAPEPPVLPPDESPLEAIATQTPTAPQLSGPLLPVPITPTSAHEWSGYIPFDQLPQLFDPKDGIVATANSRTAPDNAPYPITLNWGAPYRNERIWHRLAQSTHLTPADMLALQTDLYSDFDHVLAQRLAYALDESLLHANHTPAESKTLHQAADLLRTFNGRMTTDSAAATILSATHAALWPALLAPQLTGKPVPTADFDTLYIWGERDFALEQILMHTPARWLPPNFANWNDFLATVVLRALAVSKAPADLATWRYGDTHTVDIEHPVFAQSPMLRRLLGLPTGTGPQPQSGDHTTVKQVGHTFGPSARFTADFANLNRSTLNIVLGQSSNPMSPYFLDQFPAWLKGATFPLAAPATHTLTLNPR